MLPFVDLSESREGDVFGDGLAEELINSLGQVPGLHVVARTLHFQFKQKDIDIREIGRKSMSGTYSKEASGNPGITCVLAFAWKTL